MPAAGRGYLDGKEPCLVGKPAHHVAGFAGADTLDPNDIFSSIGEVPYAWRIEPDVLTWGSNVADVLKVSDRAAIASGRAFAQLVDAQGGQTRFDAIMRSTSRDEGAGVPYQVQYALRLPQESEPLSARSFSVKAGRLTFTPGRLM